MALTLGIETSCDETSVAVVEDGRRILSNVIHSQVELHRDFGGVVPELAARDHLERLPAILDMALDNAQVKPFISGSGGPIYPVNARRSRARSRGLSRTHERT